MLKAPIVVVLGAHELAYAWRIAKERTTSSASRGYQNRHGYNGDRLRIDLTGAAGELAGCNALGLPWPASVNTFKLPDAGRDIQIRTAPCRRVIPPHDFGTLIVRPDDPLDHRFVLVVGNPPHFVLKGWVLGREARVLGDWRAEAERPAAWFVPWWRLHTDLSWIASYVEGTG
jgi:hypothetical protein